MTKKELEAFKRDYEKACREYLREESKTKINMIIDAVSDNEGLCKALEAVDKKNMKAVSKAMAGDISACIIRFLSSDECADVIKNAEAGRVAETEKRKSRRAKKSPDNDAENVGQDGGQSDGSEADTGADNDTNSAGQGAGSVADNGADNGEKSADIPSDDELKKMFQSDGERYDSVTHRTY